MSDTCKGKVCPRLSAPGIEVVCIEHRCAHYQHIVGTNPQTGETLDHWDCAFNWTNLLLIKNAQEIRQYAAAVESMRNEARADALAIGKPILALVEQVRAPARVVEDAPSGGFRRLMFWKG